MAVAPHPSLLFSVGLGTLILWRGYSRVRRMIGRQKLTKVRHWVTVIVFPLLFALLMIGSLAHIDAVLALLLGGGCGVALGWYGLRLTKFEKTDEGLFYTPSAHLGIALSLLFFGRLAYRVVQMYTDAEQTSGDGLTDIHRSVLTLVIFAMLAGYYVTYSIGLLRWSRRADNTKTSVDPAIT